jgi:hypothetical protein
MNPILLVLALVLGIWVAYDLLTGTVKYYPGRFGPGAQFTREDDGPVFYIVVLMKGAGALYLLVSAFRS